MGLYRDEQKCHAQLRPSTLGNNWNWNCLSPPPFSPPSPSSDPFWSERGTLRVAISCCHSLLICSRQRLAVQASLSLASSSLFFLQKYGELPNPYVLHVLVCSSRMLGGGGGRGKGEGEGALLGNLRAYFHKAKGGGSQVLWYSRPPPMIFGATCPARGSCWKYLTGCPESHQKKLLKLD